MVKEHEEEILDEENVSAERPAMSFEDNVVTLGDREFTIEEPTVEITLRILNIIGSLGLRGERHAVAQVMNEPTSRAALFGILAVMDVNDLGRFGSAVLQFEDDREGRKWMKELREKGERKIIAPLVKAFFLNWSRSEDLQEALANFYQGVATLGTKLGNLRLFSGENE